MLVFRPSSRLLLDPVLTLFPPFLVDCGAGIGRVTRELLLPLFRCVDMVEQDQTFSDTARKNMPEDRVPNVRVL